MGTQKTLIEVESIKDKDTKYSTKIAAPIYEPKNQKPHIMLLCDDSKTKALLKEIDESTLPEDEKRFLREAAHRHSVFHYGKIADYYSHSSKEMQLLMEKSALVIVDFNSAIENGFVKVCKRIHQQYLQEYGDEPTAE